MRILILTILILLTGCSTSYLDNKRHVLKECVKELVQLGAVVDKATDSCIMIHSRKTMTGPEIR